MTLWHPATIAEMNVLTPAITRVAVRLRSDPLRFRAGQYVLVRAEGGSESAFSIASAPRDGQPLEFLVSSHSTVSTFDRADAPLEVSDAMGDLGLDPEASGHLFIGTGTGIAPLRSMIREWWAERSAGPALLIYGHRHPGDLAFLDEFEALSARRPEFRFLPVASRGAGAGVRRARVTEVLALSGDAHRDWAAYVTGRPQVVSEVRTALRRDGVLRRRIYADLPEPADR